MAAGNSYAPASALDPKASADERTPIQAWQLVVSYLVLAGLSAGVLVVFSDVFKTGDDVLAKLGISSSLRNYLAYIGAACFLLIYILDYSYWPGKLGAFMRRLCVLMVLALLLAAALVSQVSAPYVPLGVCLLSLPFGALFMSGTMFRTNDKAQVAKVLGIAFLLASLTTLILWIVWFLGGIGGGGVRAWAAKRTEFTQLANCNAVDANGNYIMARRQVLANGEATCLSAMLLWATPIILTCVLFVLGIFLFFVGKALSGEASLANKALKMLGGVVFLSVLGLYTSVTVVGAGSGLATAGFAIFGVCLISTVVVLASIIGFDSLTTQVLEHPVVAKMRNLGPGAMNFMHALAFFFGIFPFVFFILLSVLNQMVRRIDHYVTACQFAMVLEGEEARKVKWLTAAANRQLQYLKSWEWTAVLNNVQTICLVMWALNYGASLTYLVLNALIAALITVHWAIVSVLLVVIGLVMFLIPVVPGTAVYLTFGVLLVPVCEAAWSGCQAGGACLALNATATSAKTVAADCSKTDGASFWLAVVWANFLVVMLKIAAHICQMKLFGETFGKRASVRAQVSPNSRAMKAIRLILEKPGLNGAKVCIMCGGPDWPVSVLCGMLNLSYLQTSLGLVPIVLFTVPTVLAGAFKTKSSGSSLAGLDSLAMVVLLLLNTVFGLAMVYLTNKTVTNEKAALEAIPDDEEVKASDEAKARISAIRSQATKFTVQPRWAQLVLVASTALLSISAYGLMLFPSRLFQPFSLTDCRSTLGVQAPYTTVPPIGASTLGLVALVFLLLSILLGKVFGIWADGATKAAAGKVEPA